MNRVLWISHNLEPSCLENSVLAETKELRQYSPGCYVFPNPNVEGVSVGVSVNVWNAINNFEIN
jgi:hypothetical protein